MKKSQQGITLLESLVALMVLSIGLLGTAHLMATGIKQSNSSFARTQATYFAENIAERMRANPQAITDMDYAGYDSDGEDCAAAVAKSCAGYGATAKCESNELATFDKYQASCGQGNNGIKSILPNGRLMLTCNNVPCDADSTYTIQVNWSETEAAGAVDETKIKSVQHVILP